MRAHPECPKPRDMHARGVSPKHSDRRAVEGRLVDEHLPLVRQAVSDMSRRLPRHVRKDDLESAAMLGLAQAARSFDPDRGIAFERHASNRIRGALLDELRGADWASRSVRSKARRMQRTADELAVELGHEPTRVQLAAQLGVDTQALERLEENVHRATVLNYDSIVEQGEELLPTGEAPPEAVLLDRERRAYLVDAVLALPERLRQVVRGYFFEERPMHEIADELGVTESRVSQLRTEALALIRDGLTANLDPEALPPEPRPNGRLARLSSFAWVTFLPLPPFPGLLVRFRTLSSLHRPDCRGRARREQALCEGSRGWRRASLVGGFVHMADPMLVRRLAIDLRNFSYKTLSRRRAGDSYRPALVRVKADDNPFDDTELPALKRKIQSLWEALDRIENGMRDATQQTSPLLWLE